MKASEFAKEHYQLEQNNIEVVSIQSAINFAEKYQVIRNKELINTAYNLSIEKLELIEMLKQSIEEINHLKFEYKDKGHCGKFLQNADLLITNLTFKIK